MKKKLTADTKDKKPAKQRKAPAKKLSVTNEAADSDKALLGRRFEKGYIVETSD